MSDRLDEIRARLIAATPGAVRVHRSDNSDGSVEHQLQVDGDEYTVLGGTCDSESRLARHDAALWANARPDLEFLLAEHARLTATIIEVAEFCDALDGQCSKLPVDILNFGLKVALQTCAALLRKMIEHASPSPGTEAYVRANIAALESLLSTCSDGDILGRMGIEAKLVDFRAQLLRLQGQDVGGSPEKDGTG